MRINKDVISSNQNNLVKEVIKIKNEPASSLFVEGTKLIREALNSGHAIEYCLISEKVLEEITLMSPYILQYPYYVVSEKVISKICDTMSPQGIVAIINFKFVEGTIDGNFIVLDNIQDPGNMGNIIRSASGTRFRDICLINGANPLNQKVVRSTMGRLFSVNIYKFQSHDDFISFSKINNLHYYSCSMQGEDIFSIKKFDNRCGIVIGNEGNGVSDKLKSTSKGTISIPMKNNLESLNASVSLGIIAYYLDNLNLQK